MRRSALSRNTPLKRTRMKAKPVERDWSDALAKRDREGRCRVCGSRERVQMAHVIGREHDVKVGDGRWVNPDHIVPLCEREHALYDRHELDLLPYLSLVEQAAAVLLVGMEKARRRITCTRP
jgi:hypothetical protein